MDDLGGSGSGENDNIGLETVSLDDIEDIDDPDEELDDL